MSAIKVEVPFTRSKSSQGRPNTRSRSVSKATCFLPIPVKLCDGSRKNATRPRTELTSNVRDRKSEVSVKSPAINHSVSAVKNRVCAPVSQKRPRLCSLSEKSISGHVNVNCSHMADIVRSNHIRAWERNRPNTRNVSATSRKLSCIYKAVHGYNLRPREMNINDNASVKLERGARVKLESRCVKQTPPRGEVMIISAARRGPARQAGPYGNGCVETHPALSNQRANVAPYCPKSIWLVKSGNSTRRAAKPSHCALCGELRYTAPKRRNRIQVKSRSTEPEPPTVRVQTGRTNSISAAPKKKLTIWTGMFPKVKLCNIAKCACDVSLHDLRCVRPVGLTTEVDCCFKRDVGTSRLQRPTVRQQTLTGAHIVKAATPCPTASLSLEGRTSEDPTNHTASLLLGAWARGPGMLYRDVEEDRRAGKDFIATEKWGAKRIRLGRSGRDSTASLQTPDQDSSSVADLAEHSGITMPAAGGVAMESVMASDGQSCLDTRIGYSDASDTRGRTRGSVRQDGGQRTDPGGSDTSQDSSECGPSSLGPDEVLFSCQRVIPCVKRLQLSCARTSIPWPFPKRDPPPVTYECDSNETVTAGSVESSTDDFNCALGGRERYSPVSTERTTVAPTHAATDATQSTSHRRSPQKEGKKRKKSDVKEEGEKEEGDLSEKDKGEEKRALLPFSDRPSKATPSFLPVQEAPECAPLPKTDTPPPIRDLMETEKDTVSVLPPLKDGAETAALAADPVSRPMSVGLSDTDTATPDNIEFEDVFSCQRAIPHVKRPQQSCARTYIAWPFREGGPPSATHARDDSETAEPVESSADPASTPSSVCLGDTDIATASSSPRPTSSSSAPDDIRGLAPSSASPSPNKAAPSAPSPSSSSPASEHQDEADATSGSNLSSDNSETDPGSSPPPTPHLQSLEDSAHSSKSALFLPRAEPVETQSYSGEEESSEEDVGEEEDACGESQPSSSGDQGSAGDPGVELLDEFTAYEQDILVVSVEDDPELFGNLPKESLLCLGPTRRAGAPGARTTREGITPPSTPRSAGPLCATKKSLTNGDMQINDAKTNQRKWISFNEEEESDVRSWKTQSRPQPSLMHSNSWPPVDCGLYTQDQVDSNNNRVTEPSERTLDIQTLNSSTRTIPSLMPMDVCVGRGSRIKNPSEGVRHTKSKYTQYCRYYFKDNCTCLFKNCWFLHVPREGDEKFCVETVQRFSIYQNPAVLQKAVAVFTGYYQRSPPGAHFTPLLLSSLLVALLKAGFVSDIIAVLHISAAHKIIPSPNFLLALFDYVRQKGLRSAVPELKQLTSKMVEAGLVLSMDYCERVLHSLDPQPPQMDSLVPASANLWSPSIKIPKAEPMNVAQGILEVELCTALEDWSRMGVLFLSVCHAHRAVGELQRFSGCVAVALLSETKDGLALPFATFSETVCQGACKDGVVMAFLGRIGVSLMCRYHKTQQWTKGRRVLEVLSRLKVNYSTLKGLFGNEDGASRCRLVTVAAELFFHSGSVEGALNTLQDNEWFLRSSAWPCEPADLAERSGMLVRLAEQTSHRDTLEVLTNLPGLKEPTDIAEASQYVRLFNSHLHACVERQTLPVASDTLDFMLSKTLAVDPPLLHTLLHKLGKTNNWLRARALFKRALCVGYYPGVSALPGSLVLTVPCLGEIELALALEMFITVNAAAVLDTTEEAARLSITLSRSCDSESEYLSAGSCLLSAAVVLKPTLTVRYQAVNSSQEQLFTLHTPSAQRWLTRNRSWANELWTHSP